MIPCGGAKVNRITGFFRAWRGVFAGACPSAPCVVGLPKRCPRDGVPLTALARPAPGERTISNAEVPLPRSPLSLATGTAHRKACSIGFAPKRRLPAALGTCLAGTISAVGGSVQGCRGRSPRRNKLWGSPLPAGKGVGGMGAARQAKGWCGRRQRRQTTLWVPPTPAAPATCRTSHPSGTTNTRRPGDLPGKPPFGHLQRRFSPCRFRLGRGDARGEAPCMKITLISPFPGGEGGQGDGGKKANQRQGWQATKKVNHPLGTTNTRRPGDLPGKPPAGHHSGWDSQCRRGTPPHRAPQRQG